MLQVCTPVAISPSILCHAVSVSLQFQFCHSFLYLLRENIEGEEKETPLAAAIDRIHAAFFGQKADKPDTALYSVSPSTHSVATFCLFSPFLTQMGIVIFVFVD